MTERPQFYHLSTWLEAVDVLVTVNGFPVIEERCPVQSSTTAPLNHVLCGERNVIAWTVAGLAEPGPVAGERVTLGVHRYFAGELADTAGGPSDRALLRWSLDEWAEARRVAREPTELPQTLQATLAAPGTDCFSDLLDRCEPVTLSECFDYARSLHALFIRRDLDAIVREFSPRIAGYACARRRPRSECDAGFAELMQAFLRRELVAVPPADALEATRWCDGKLVRLRRPAGTALLIGVDPDDGSKMSIDVFVAKVHGKPYVVR